MVFQRYALGSDCLKWGGGEIKGISMLGQIQDWSRWARYSFSWLFSFLAVNTLQKQHVQTQLPAISHQASTKEGRIKK